MRDKREWRGAALLLLTAAIWGSAFVAQSVAADTIGAFTFQTARSLLGGTVLLPVLAARAFLKKRRPTGEAPKPGNRRTLAIGGLLCGAVLAIASCFQQFGVADTTVGNAGFITALYILIVPLLGLPFHKRVSARLWGCILLALTALYLLSVKEGFTVSRGDGLVMVCAVCFSVHILLVDYFIQRVDGLSLACLQFLTAGLLCAVPMLLFERPNPAALRAAWLPVVYAGVLSSGVGYTCQILGQRYTRPALASLLMSFESVFAVLAAMLVLGQIPAPREAIGCVLMFVAIMAAQLPAKGKQKTP